MDQNTETNKTIDMNKKGKQNSQLSSKEKHSHKEEEKAKAPETKGEEGSRVEELEKLVEEQKQKIDELNDKYLRSLADRDNLVKRTQKEKEAISKYGLESFMLEFLPVLDSLDKVELSFSEATQNDSISSYKEGFLLVKQQILKVLEKHGVVSFSSVGEKFDPNRHQAMSRVEVEGVSEETVKEEYLKGYTINGKLLRASFVVVQVPKSK